MTAHACRSEAFEQGGWDAVGSVVLSPSGESFGVCDECARLHPERVRAIDRDADGGEEGDGLTRVALLPAVADLGAYRRRRHERTGR